MKTENRSRKTRRTALCGILSAVSVAIIYIAVITDLFSYTGLCVAAVIVLFVKVEYGMGAAVSVYGVVSVLSLLILPDKSAAVLYAAIAGLYPLFKSYFDMIRPAALRWLSKLAAANGIAAAIYFVGRALFFPDAESPLLVAATFVLFSAVFVICDLLFDKLTLIYTLKYRSVLKRRGIL